MIRQAILRTQKGFTLIEILVVIGIIAILAAIVIIAINPAKQFAQARNTQREAGVNTILNAIGQRLADNKGMFAGTFKIGTPSVTYTCGVLPLIAAGATPTAKISDAGTLSDPAVTSSDLGCLVPTYVATLPIDPDATYAHTAALPNYTGFDVGADPTGRITVCAAKGDEPSIPGAAAICVTR